MRSQPEDHNMCDTRRGATTRSRSSHLASLLLVVRSGRHHKMWATPRQQGNPVRIRSCPATVSGDLPRVRIPATGACTAGARGPRPRGWVAGRDGSVPGRCGRVVVRLPRGPLGDPVRITGHGPPNSCGESICDYRFLIPDGRSDRIGRPGRSAPRTHRRPPRRQQHRIRSEQDLGCHEQGVPRGRGRRGRRHPPGPGPGGRPDRPGRRAP